MSDKEKIEKIYEFVKAQEDYFYKPIEDGKYELGSMANIAANNVCLSPYNSCIFRE